MTAATKPKPTTPTAHLEKLEAKRTEAHNATLEHRRKRDAWNAEVKQLRDELTVRQSTHPDEFRGSNGIAIDGTEAGDLLAAIRERLHGRNPHLTSFEKARDVFHEIDALVSDWKNKHVHDRIAEVVSDREDDAKARKALTALQEWVHGELELVNRVHQVVVEDTPVLCRQSNPTLGSDPRLHEWQTYLAGMAEALEEGVTEPHLTPHAEHRVSSLG